ncbi:MAG: hypothetical protein IT343_12305 [Candidatus Melainabacteria bacterium]|jgi:hypothetical protein|nr:hypothetical protein [Candidatus Melainabacteria bacterium]
MGIRILILSLFVVTTNILIVPATANPDSTSGMSDGSSEAKSPASLKQGVAALQNRIDALKQSGTGVAPFQQILDRIQDLDKGGKLDDASKLMSDLSSKLGTLEGLRDQARRANAAKVGKTQRGIGAAVATGNAANRPATGTVNELLKRQSADIANLGPRPGESALANNVRQRVFCVRQQAMQLQLKFGVPADAYLARIKAAEQLSSTLPWQALTDMTAIECDMNQAAETAKPKQ